MIPNICKKDDNNNYDDDDEIEIEIDLCIYTAKY